MCNYIKQDEQKYLDWILNSKREPFSLRRDKKFVIPAVISIIIMLAGGILLATEVKGYIPCIVFFPGLLLFFSIMFSLSKREEKYTRALKDYYLQYHELPPFDWRMDGNWIKDQQ